MGWYNEKKKKKTTDQYAEEKRWVFSFDLKEENEDEVPSEYPDIPSLLCNGLRAPVKEYIHKIIIPN